MTMLINLSEGEYEGGDLIVNKKVADFRKPGSAILFKSHLIHEVTPVTKGEREILKLVYTQTNKLNPRTIVEYNQALNGDT